MDLQQWKQAAKEKLEALASELRTGAPEMLYGALSAATLLPLVAAVNQGDYGALVAATGVVGGIGGNLIANQIQAWKDRPVLEVAAEIEAKAEADPEWRAALDALLDEFEAPRVVQAILSEAERDWFVDALRAELDEIGSGLTIEIDNDGLLVMGDRNVAVAGDVRDSTIITGDSNVLTDGGAYVGGDVDVKRGDFVGRDQVRIGSVEMLRIASAIFQAAPEPGEVAPKELLWTYLNQVITDTGTLDLAGVDRRTVDEQQEARLELAAVYTALDTLRSVEKEGGRRRAMDTPFSDSERERQSALAFVVAEPYAALLGDPGSGKTTFVNFVALCLAGEMLGLDNVNLTRLGEEWTLGSLLPVRVVLRNFAAAVDTLNADEQTLWAYLAHWLGHSVSGFEPLLNKHLVEQGGLLILDGLDEVPEGGKRREQVKHAILAFKRRFPRVRILLTSRTYAYQRQAWRLPGFEETVLAAFSPTQIDAFLDGWYGHMAQVRPNLTTAEAEGRARLLKDAIQHNDHLRELAPRPLLLTLMASLHAWRGGSLPDEREQLYDESVELLLDIWERPKIVLEADGKPAMQTAGAAEWLRCPRARVKQALEKLAYTVHAQQDAITGTADIGEEQLVSALLKAANDPELKPARVVEYVSDRAGLLSNRGEGIYRFPHRTFQEYMAARYLTTNGFPNLLVKLVKEDPERWREVLLLAGAKVARGTPYAAWSLVTGLCPQGCEATRQAAATDADWWAALLAGQLLMETGIYAGLDPEHDLADLETLGKVRVWLTALVEGEQLPPVDRAAAGTALGLLGDARPGVGVTDGVPDIAWSDVIEPGPFEMGGEGRYDGKPQFTCNLIRDPYRISRFAVTVAQFHVFLRAGGYERSAYWLEAEAAGIWNDGRLRCHTYSLEQREYVEGWVNGPADYGPAYNAPNQPQVGVSWVEAVAYCRWVTEALGREVRLPTEAEWERAARHTDGRDYPWEGVFDKRHCNMAETGIGLPASVGLFASGNVVCGASDMAGNVWEWCSTRWLDDYEAYEAQVDDSLDGDARRVVRGGAFVYSQLNVRCAARLDWSRDFRDDDVGFRLLAPGLDPLREG